MGGYLVCGQCSKYFTFRLGFSVILARLTGKTYDIIFKNL